MKNISGKYSYLIFLLIFLPCFTYSTILPNQVDQKEKGTTKGPAADYLKALLRFEAWAESTWHDYPAIPGSGYFGDGATTGNGGIRGTCGVALAYAVLIRAFPDSPQRDHWIKRVKAALLYAVQTHAGEKYAAVDGKQWGILANNSLSDPQGWQSSLWAATMGFAAALLEKDLDPALLAGCKQVVAEEADWLSHKPPPSGYKLDTKAEENAWQSNIVSLAAAWMPHDPRANRWLKTARLYLANTYTVPADSAGALKKWIQTQTLFPSFALQNHGFYHPTYQMVAGMSLGDSYLMARMINPAVAEKLKPFAEHNVKPVWKFLQDLVLDSGQLAYPSGLDWSLNDFEHVSYLAWLAAHFKDPQAQWAEPRLARQILYRQSVNGDGRFVGESCPDGFYREAVEARRVAMAYLQDRVAGFPEHEGAPPENRIINYPDVGLIIQRSDHALVTVSYGTKPTALVYPLKGRTPAQRFLISPNITTLLGGGKGKAQLESFKKTPSGFSAKLILDAETGRGSRMVIESTGDAVVFIEIPSENANLSKNGWLLSAIENDPLTGGERTLYWKDHSTTIDGRSGINTPWISSGWIDVDHWMGFIAVPEGGLSYRAAAGYNRNGAAEDDVFFKPDSLQIPRAVILLPGKDASATKNIAQTVKWKADTNQCSLSFTLPGKKAIRILVPEEVFK